MDQSMKIQMDIKNNMEDLHNYALDLNNWEKEMKKKEAELSNEKTVHYNHPPPRNKIKRNKPTVEKTCSSKAKKISGYDYSAWDKYDVEKACADLESDEDENVSKGDEGSDVKSFQKAKEDSSSSEDDEDKTSLIDRAYYEKELGNQFVKKEKWDNALKCYTNAINLDSKNPIYYANRSLCFLKLKNFKCAEVDATTALQLDKDYVKAYQRRAYARLALGQLQEAKSDFEAVLQIEPKNSLMEFEVKKINDKLNKELKFNQPVANKNSFNHKNIFKEKTPVKVVQKSLPKSSLHKLGNANVQETPIIKPMEEPKKKTSTSKIENCALNRGDGDKISLEDIKKIAPSVFGKLPDHCRTVCPIQIPPHKRSKKPLRRIPIEVVNDDENYFEAETNETNATISKSKLVSEMKENVLLTKLNHNANDIVEKFSLDMPKTSVQFRYCWKNIRRKPEDAYKYLRNVSERLPQIFENSLESDLFSDLITFLAEDNKEKQLDVVYSVLLNLSLVKRFSSMVLFMSAGDKACLKKCITELKDVKTENEVTEILRLYEL